LKFGIITPAFQGNLLSLLFFHITDFY